MPTLSGSKRVEELSFDNRFTRELPSDPDDRNVPRQVKGACYSRVRPVGFSSPRLVAVASEVSELVGLDYESTDTDAFTQVFAGSRVLEAMDPHAMCYGGHQFGHWAGQLGDGRAINLGDVVGSENKRWTLQLKGAGPTPYSRTADGLAVLRSSLREFLCSEAMHHLGVPTTRALSLVLTGESVVRDMFYDGHPRPEPGAVVCRVAPSFTRFGNFEIFASRQEVEVLRQLVDYTIRADFAHLGEPSPEVYRVWFDEVCRSTAAMVVEWMRVGFVHGVMNTDNMSILGLTIDYGPYGWLENFDPDWTPNTTDATGRRYRYGHQHQIALWNLVKLAEAIYPIIGDAKPLEASLDGFGTAYQVGFRKMMASKLGLSLREDEHDTELISGLFALLPEVETDMTIFFRRLGALAIADESADRRGSDIFDDAYYVPTQLGADYVRERASWLDRYRARVRDDGLPDDERRRRMDAVNPKYVLRNYLAQLATDKADGGDFSMVTELLDVLRRPYDEQPEHEELAAKRPDWARNRPGCSMLSCSS